MSGVSSGVGYFSGINSGQIIEQLLAIDARPKVLAQQRILQLQQQQAAYLDLNSKVQALKTAAGAFRLNNVFTTNAATSSAPDVLSATASTGAIPGSYQFVVDRLVSSQQSLTRGFTSATAGLSAGSFSFESADARLDRDTALSDLNGGHGIQRGRIVISDTTHSTSATIDLSRAATVSDVIDAINAGTGIDVTASVQDGKFVITSNSGGSLTVTNATGSTTATSLGIEHTSASGATVTGSTVYALGQDTALSSLNDGNGVFRNSVTGSARYDFTVTVGGTAVNVNIGNKYNNSAAITEAAPTTLGGVLTRINDALQAALGNEDAKAEIAPDGVSLRIVDAQNRTIAVAENTATSNSTTAADLGLKTTSVQTGTVAGARILSGLNTTLARTLNGGSGVAGDGVISITGRDGVVRTVNVSTTGTLQQIADAFSAQTGGAITATLNRNGTGLELADTTGGTGNLIVGGASATSLGIATDPAGVAAATVSGTNLQHQYITGATSLDSLRAGQGVGTGSFRITDSHDTSAVVTVDSNIKTVDDLIRNINSKGTRIRARINDHGDGILLYEDSAGAGASKIKVTNESGSAGSNLNLVAEASGTGASNFIDGSYERTVTFDAADSLQTIANKITAAGVGVSAAVINDGSGSTPFRLSLTARNSGSAGRFIVDSGSFDLGVTTLDKGQDARVFYGSTDPARAILLTSSRNTLDSVITGVTIDLKSVSASPVTISVARDTDGIETAINTFITAFNSLADSIESKTSYDQDSNTKAPLLGDSTTLSLRSSLYNIVQGHAIGISSQFDQLADVGISVGTGGKLTFDRDRLRAALEQDPQGVADLFAARVLAPPDNSTGIPNVTVSNPDAPIVYASQGVATQVENFADSLINSVTGTLTRRNQNLDDQISDQNKRIADMDARLETRRQVLQNQFLQMEQAIGALQQQQQSLSQLGG
jgi:flagellar hook-associated protein 2